MPRYWMQYGSTFYEIGSVDPGEITIDEIAHAASLVNRFTGHSTRPIAIADHMVFVSQLLDVCPGKAMYGLVHDVAETVTNDISWPLKKSMPEEVARWFDAVEAAADLALWKVLDVDVEWPDEVCAAVKEADWAAVGAERRDYLLPCARNWDMLETVPTYKEIEVSFNPTRAKEGWLARYYYLKPHFDRWAEKKGLK